MVLVVRTVLFKSTFHVFFLALFLLFVYFCFISFPPEYVYIQRRTKEQSLQIQKRIYLFLPWIRRKYLFLLSISLFVSFVIVLCIYLLLLTVASPSFLPKHKHFPFSFSRWGNPLFTFFSSVFGYLMIWRLLCSSFFFVLWIFMT